MKTLFLMLLYSKDHVYNHLVKVLCSFVLKDCSAGGNYQIIISISNNSHNYYAGDEIKPDNNVRFMTIEYTLINIFRP